MQIPPVLEGYVREGRTVLFLGAGASVGAKDTKGNTPPTAKQLGHLLSDRFLGGKHKNLPLSQIAEYAISEADLITVQEYIREIFEGFEPTAAHSLLPAFTWWGLATTNYDRLIERVYETSPSALQVPRPFIENGDRVEDHLRDSRNVMLLKLHGCITRTANTDCPLILTTDQYVTHRRGRSRIFDHLHDWAIERPVVFIGHGLEDPDIRAMLLELTGSIPSRPRYYAILPGVDEIQQRFWEGKKVTLLDGTFEEFVRSLDAKIPSMSRGLAVLVQRLPVAISEKLKRPVESLSTPTRQFVETDVDYVRSITATETLDPHLFYKGFSPGWSAVEQALDTSRHLGDSILADHFLIPETDHRGVPEVILLKGHAGAGKSVLLRRLAWDAAKEYDLFCLYLRRHGVLNVAALQELVNASDHRLYLFVDDAAER